MGKNTDTAALTIEQVLYGEVMNNLTVSTNKLLARASYGEETIVVMVLNGNTSGSGTFLSPFSISPVSGAVTVPIPAWLPVQQVYEVRPEGTNAASYSLGGGSLTLIGRNTGAVRRTPVRTLPRTAAAASGRTLPTG